MKNVKHFFLFFPGIIVTGILYTVYALATRKRIGNETQDLHIRTVLQIANVFISIASWVLISCWLYVKLVIMK